MTLTPDESLKSYSPELLKTLEDAFQSVWTTLYAHMPIGGDDAKELKITLEPHTRPFGRGGHNRSQKPPP